MKCTTLGIDLAKSVFQLHGVDMDGKVVIQKRTTRAKLRETVARFTQKSLQLVSEDGSR